MRGGGTQDGHDPLVSWERAREFGEGERGGTRLEDGTCYRTKDIQRLFLVADISFHK